MTTRKSPSLIYDIQITPYTDMGKVSKFKVADLEFLAIELVLRGKHPPGRVNMVKSDKSDTSLVSILISPHFPAA